jgi:hypothetical protein
MDRQKVYSYECLLFNCVSNDVKIMAHLRKNSGVIV